MKPFKTASSSLALPPPWRGWVAGFVPLEESVLNVSGFAV
jgi:hypothetical protein